MLLIGSGDGGLYSINRHDGTVRWRFDAGAAVTSASAVGAGVA